MITWKQECAGVLKELQLTKKAFLNLCAMTPLGLKGPLIKIASDNQKTDICIKIHKSSKLKLLN